MARKTASASAPTIETLSDPMPEIALASAPVTASETTPNPVQSEALPAAEAPMVGQELLDLTVAMADSSARKIAVAAGYFANDKRGFTRPDLKEFQAALLSAKGVTFGKEKAAPKKKATSGTVVINGREFLVLSRHHLELAWSEIAPGMAFTVSDASGGSILLTPVPGALEGPDV